MDDPSFFEEDLDEEKAKRSILVTDVPDNLSPKDVVIYFQRKSNGGGEVVNLDELGSEHRSSVVITFEDPSIAENVITRPHIINKKEVTVQGYPIETRIHEIFSCVDARLNPDLHDVFGSVSSLKQVLHSLGREHGIECHKNAYGYVISGSYKQITLSRKYILDEIRNGKTTRRVAPGSASNDIEIEDESPQERGTKSKSTGTSVDAINETTYQSVPIILQFIFTVAKYANRIRDIESEFVVKIEGIESDSKVAIRPLPGCKRGDHHDACEKYIDLYKEVYDGPMMSKNILLRPGSGSHYSAKDAVKEVLKINPIAVQKMDKQDKWLFYGEEMDVRSAIAKVCKMLKIDNPLKIPRKVRARPATDEEEKDIGAAHRFPMSSVNDATYKDVLLENPSNIRSPIHKEFPSDKEQPFVIKTRKGFQLTVYQGDIVQEEAEVIVNTTDEFLGFHSGLSRALVDRGGRAITKQASDENKWRKIKPGDIILTEPGHLKCLQIYHLITHSTKNKEKYKLTAKEGCLGCLKRAQKHKLKSIAFPALGTGKNGMPLNTCASAMINAVEEYMKDNDPKNGAVADIRFVHLDPKAAEVFKTELTKRYGDSIVKPSESKGYGRDSDYETLSVPLPDKKPDIKTGKKEEEDVCPICLDGFHNPTFLSKCKHKFCQQCIEQAFRQRKVCPTCGMTYGVQTGNMPPGSMYHYFDHYVRLPGYERHGSIRIDYYFSDGTQGPEHPNPGQRYSGTSRTAYLPDCPEGREVLGLLKKAFDARLTFTIGRSVTTGASNVVTWNDIHHKTNPYGGATGFGYPDPTYLQRVKAELAAKGIS